MAEEEKNRLSGPGEGRESSAQQFDRITVFQETSANDLPTKQHDAMIAPPVSSCKKPLVLAVDDSRTLRKMLVEMLETLGCTALEAQDGQQALDILVERKGEIDVLLLDREMPVVDGMEVMRRMRESKELRRIPIVMQTGSDKPEQIKEGIDAGAFYYLTKPVNLEILKSVLSAAVRETKRQQQTNGMVT